MDSDPFMRSATDADTNNYDGGQHVRRRNCIEEATANSRRHKTGQRSVRGGGMQSYIVRIYRREKGGFLGVVEEPGAKVKRAFTGYDELWEILNARRGNHLARHRLRHRKRTPAGYTPKATATNSNKKR